MKLLLVDISSKCPIVLWKAKKDNSKKVTKPKVWYLNRMVAGCVQLHPDLSQAEHLSHKPLLCVAPSSSPPPFQVKSPPAPPFFLSSFQTGPGFCRKVKGRHRHQNHPSPLRYKSSTLILYKELSSSIFQSYQSGIGNTCPDLHFVQYIKAWMSSTDPVSPIRNFYRLIVSYTGPEHSFIIS